MNEHTIPICGRVDPQAVVIVRRGANLSVHVTLDDGDSDNFVVALSGALATETSEQTLHFAHVMRALVDALEEHVHEGETQEEMLTRLDADAQRDAMAFREAL